MADEPPLLPYPGGPFPQRPDPDSSYPERAFQEQQYTEQPYTESPGQPPYPGQPYPGQPYPGTPYPGQPAPGQTYPGPSWAYPGDPGGPDLPPRGGWSKLAIAALICAVVLPVVGLVVAIPLAIVALVRLSRRPGKGKVLAIIAIVVPVVWIVGLAAFGALEATPQAKRDDAGQIVSSGRLSIGEVRLHDCLSFPVVPGGHVNTASFRGVPCSQSHDTEVIAVRPLHQQTYPGASQLEQMLSPVCIAAVRPFVAEGYSAVPLYPEESAWSHTEARVGLCLLVKRNTGTWQGQP